MPRSNHPTATFTATGSIDSPEMVDLKAGQFCISKHYSHDSGPLIQQNIYQTDTQGFKLLQPEGPEKLPENATLDQVVAQWPSGNSDQEAYYAGYMAAKAFFTANPTKRLRLDQCDSENVDILTAGVRDYMAHQNIPDRQFKDVSNRAGAHPGKENVSAELHTKNRVKNLLKANRENQRQSKDRRRIEEQKWPKKAQHSSNSLDSGNRNENDRTLSSNSTNSQDKRR